MNRSWKHIVWLWLIGVLAAAQLAKFAVMAPILRERFGLTLAQAGFLISLLEIGGALFGFEAGLLIGRLGARRLLIAGLALLASASAAEGVGESSTMLFAARAVEGMGYLLVVIAAPTLIIAVANERSRSAALALWSTFVPVGMAFGSVVTGTMVGTLPALSGARSGVDGRIAAANGLVTQFGAAGALVGPPLGALLVETWDWAVLGIAIAVLAGAMLSLVLLAEALAHSGSAVTAPGPLATGTIER